MAEISHFVETLQGFRAVPDLSQQFQLLQEEFGRTSDFWNSGGTVPENLNAVISYYQKFIALSQQIMKENPQADLISVSGP